MAKVDKQLDRAVPSDKGLARDPKIPKGEKDLARGPKDTDGNNLKNGLLFDKVDGDSLVADEVKLSQVKSGKADKVS